MGVSELGDDPLESLLFSDGETEAQGRTCLARSSMETVGNRPGAQASWLTVWSLACAMSPATAQLGESIWDRQPH